MYKIINENGDRILNFKSKTFMESFNYINKHHLNNAYIIHQSKYNTQIVWDPHWAYIDCENKLFK